MDGEALGLRDIMIISVAHITTRQYEDSNEDLICSTIM